MRAKLPATSIKESWLAQHREPILEPDLPIIDPHHHLWDRDGHKYMLDDLLQDTGSGHNIVATVFVECRSMYREVGLEHLMPVGETEFVNGIAAQSASGEFGPTRVCEGIVGFADLTLGDTVDQVLEAHIAAAPTRFRGIRHASGWDASDAVRNSHTNPPQGLLADSTFRKGLARLPAHGLSYESWLYHPQIPELTDLARGHPEVTIVFDHFGGPLGIGPYADLGEEVLTRWRKDVADLAACENVYAKLGGNNMPINGHGWHKREMPASSEELIAAGGDYYRHAIDVFGPERCMFESNFPVDKLSCSYAVVWNFFKRLASGFSATEKAALFHDTAQRIYRLS